ncbi:NPC intracellular cholesterol transporter 2 [Galendromus occidentalis]|uniref:NPC intracellular cholesterol transporter 2 n=1 Tax=Galendromus occidentalis TaxID=34638 RepID=A0AAJ6QV55_9ACAR|nr:NPC intracellular cholesterol transporter 2 [Galendromus occidentalis]
MSSSLMLVASFLLFAISVSESQLVIKKYELCGGTGSVRYIKVTPCVEEPCEFKRNSKVHVEIELAFEHPSETATLKSFADLKASNMTLVGVPTDFCKAKIVECPIRGRGDYRVAKFIVPIKKLYTPLNDSDTLQNFYNASFMGYGDAGWEICVKLLIRVLDEML